MGAQQALRPVWAEIDRQALAANLSAAIRRAGPGRRVIASVKANAYGHGLIEVSRTLVEAGAAALWTGNIPEAIALRRAGIAGPIITFGGYLPEVMASLVAHDLIPTVYDWDGAKAAAAASRGGPVPVYLKIDSGLGRLGVPLAKARDFVTAVARLPGLRIDGIYTHLPFGDAAGQAWAETRARDFAGLLAQLRTDGIEPEITQLWGSSGLLAGSPDGCNAVCVGHLLYGLSPIHPAPAEASEYQPVLSAIRGRLIAIGDRPGPANGGPPSGYAIAGGRTTGVVPFGLGDGMRRSVAGAPMHALLRGRRVPILGISLEHVVLDLDGIEAPRLGEAVTFLGQSEGEAVTLADWAAWHACRELEVVMALSGRIAMEHGVS